jgi:hypothetical protein
VNDALSARPELGLLMVAVPAEIDRMRQMGDAYRLETARKAGQYIAEHGDNLLYRSTDRRHTTAKAFAVLARGLAAAAFQPGGVTFAGMHWCIDHEACKRAEAAVRQPWQELAPTGTG